MDMQKRYADRVKRLAAALNFEKTDCIPIMGMVETWAGHNNGMSILDICCDAEKLKASYLHFAKEFDFDAIGSPMGCRWAPVYSALGSTEFSFYNEKGAPHQGVQHLGRCNMEASEYPELIADPYKFITEKLLPRKYPALNVPEPRRSLNFAKGALLYVDHIFNALIPTCMAVGQQYGLPIFMNSGTEMPLDVMCDYFRGFQNIIMDTRRHRKQVIEACEALYPILLAGAIGNQAPEMFPTVFIPLHIPTYMNTKDFAEVYFPTFKRMIIDIINAGRRPYLFMEGDWAPYAEFFQELPKKKIVGLFEYHDYKAMKKNFGDTIALIGGMPLYNLNYDSKAQVIDRTKRLIDEMAPGGGWIFGFDKSWLSSNDANADNLKAVVETVRTYGVGK